VHNYATNRTNVLFYRMYLSHTYVPRQRRDNNSHKYRAPVNNHTRPVPPKLRWKFGGERRTLRLSANFVKCLQCVARVCTPYIVTHQQSYRYTSVRLTLCVASAVKPASLTLVTHRKTCFRCGQGAHHQHSIRQVREALAVETGQTGAGL
jgi:hypothetical protein